VTRRITTLKDPAFQRLFTEFRRSWYRYECLQRYDVPYEAAPLRAFLAGQPKPHDPGDDVWADMIRGHAAAGRTMRRVHIVTEPLTDYVRYELAWAYALSVPAGEDVHIIPVPDGGAWPAGLPTHDYWLFDDRWLWLMGYDQAGRFTHADLVTDPETVGRHIAWRQTALPLGVPWRAYIDAHPDLAARVA
jgi:hypothetical protein